MIIQITRLRYEFNNNITSLNYGYMIFSMFALGILRVPVFILLIKCNFFFFFLLKFRFHFLEANKAKILQHSKDS